MARQGRLRSFGIVAICLLGQLAAVSCLAQTNGEDFETQPAVEQSAATATNTSAVDAGSELNDAPLDSAAHNSSNLDSNDSGKSLLTVLRDGGPMLIPILACSLVLFVFVFERTISLRKGRVIPGPFVTRFLHQLEEGSLKQEDALELCEENQSPVSEVFAAAAKKWNRPAVEVEQAVLDSGEREANGLRKYLRLFNGISTVCPLLGLLGTVIGMIRAFNAIATEDAMGRADLLAGGISQALLTTAAGLTVAIPAIIFYLYFVGRVDKLIIEIDSLGQRVVNAIASDGWKGKPKRKTKTEKQAA